MILEQVVPLPPMYLTPTHYFHSLLYFPDKIYQIACNRVPDFFFHFFSFFFFFFNIFVSEIYSVFQG